MTEEKKERKMTGATIRKKGREDIVIITREKAEMPCYEKIDGRTKHRTKNCDVEYEYLIDGRNISVKKTVCWKSADGKENKSITRIIGYVQRFCDIPEKDLALLENPFIRSIIEMMTKYEKEIAKMASELRGIKDADMPKEITGHNDRIGDYRFLNANNCVSIDNRDIKMYSGYCGTFEQAVLSYANRQMLSISETTKGRIKEELDSIKETVEQMVGLVKYPF